MGTSAHPLPSVSSAHSLLDAAVRTLEQRHKLVAEVVLADGRDEEGAGAQARHPGRHVGGGAARKWGPAQWAGRHVEHSRGRA